jgi:two-component system phosphate regulon sensor histidine kinase PhoR
MLIEVLTDQRLPYTIIEMALTKKTVRLVVAVMVISLAGLVALQTSLLSDAYASKEASFRRNVQAAMGSVADQLETAETVSATLTVVGDAREIIIARRGSPDDPHLSDTIDLPALGGSRGIVWADIRYISSPDHRLVNILRDIKPTFTQSHEAYVEVIDTVSFDTTTDDSDSTYLVVHYTRDSTGMGRHHRIENDPDADPMQFADSSRMAIISRVMDRIVADQDLPIEDRVDPAHLDSLIENALDEYGIELEPIYGILLKTDSSLHLEQPEGFDAELRGSEFQAALFPSDILAAPVSLVLHFPERGVYLVKQMGPMLAATIGFMLVVVFGFTYTVRTLVAQRRTSRQMVDFVNNMTHEFKTPISTVALACEAILRQDVISDAKRVSRFSHMIQDENQRMRLQVDKILQMAALEESRGDLKLAPVDVHDVIRNAVDAIDLQVQKRSGRITCRLESRHPIIPADEVHLTGIIYNLLDNANKYSPEAPEIVVSTEDTPGGLQVVVEDHGRGLSPEDARRVFDKYFRVTHGNVHDVKGFGLGLSYVHLMVKAHGGEISVDSSHGRGTRMVVRFPGQAPYATDESEATS